MPSWICMRSAIRPREWPDAEWDSGTASGSDKAARILRMSVDKRSEVLNFQSRLRLDGKVAMVIGAGGFGMGTPTSLGLAEAGATVVCVDQSEAVVDEITNRIRQAGSET